MNKSYAHASLHDEPAADAIKDGQVAVSDEACGKGRVSRGMALCFSFACSSGTHLYEVQLLGVLLLALALVDVGVDLLHGLQQVMQLLRLR